MADQGDPTFPGLHIRPQAGWLNDPNGVSRIDGTYHVFFQYNPRSARHGQICWGHYISPDLVTWREQPLALVPRPGEADSFGCWTGCVTTRGKVPVAVYSGAAVDGGDTSVLLATSDREMRTWIQEDHPVATTPAGIQAMRDPYLVAVDGHRWAVQCAVLGEGGCTVIVHDCDDLYRWTYQGQLLSPQGLAFAQQIAPAAVWECPQLCRIDDTWVLILSPLVGVAGEPLDLDQVAWLTGELRSDSAGLRFEPSAGGRLDVGPAFYAPQVLVTPSRALAWGWIHEHGRKQDDSDSVGWAGAVSFPRELRVIDGGLVSAPAPELAGLRRRLLHSDSTPGHDMHVRERAFEIEAGPSKDGAPSPVRLELGSPSRARRAEIPIPAPAGATVRAFVDGSVIEAFIDGQPSRTHRAYPGPGDTWSVHAGSRPLRIWQLGLPDRTEAGPARVSPRGEPASRPS